MRPFVRVCANNVYECVHVYIFAYKLDKCDIYDNGWSFAVLKD